jgi:FkbM family methyltransferase
MAKSALAFPIVLLTAGYERLLSALLPKEDGAVRGAVIETLGETTRRVRHDGIDLRFICPNRTTVYRARTFSDKEPETLAWIDTFADDAVLWDIGANVGVYSIYAAKRHPRLRVFAFEPSVLNTELLARNISLNDVEDRVCIVPVPLSDKRGENTFTLSRVEHGGALSSFGVDYGHDGKQLTAKLVYKTFGMSMDDAIARLGITAPDHIKLDVDGIEHLILQGGPTTLANPKLKSVLVESNEDFAEQSRAVDQLLGNAGFHIGERHPTDKSGRTSGKFSRSYNCIWVRT